MTDAGSAFRLFPIEYKKRLPETPENKEFHELMKGMINYFGTSEVIYQERWDEWISPDDKRYYMEPTKEEMDQIVMRKKTRKEKSFWDYILGSNPQSPHSYFLP